MTAIPALTLEQVRRKGLEVLARELGPVGMVRFLQQSETGHGDYSQHRGHWLPKDKVSDITPRIRGIRKGATK